MEHPRQDDDKTHDKNAKTSDDKTADDQPDHETPRPGPIPVQDMVAAIDRSHAASGSGHSLGGDQAEAADQDDDEQGMRDDNHIDHDTYANADPHEKLITWRLPSMRHAKDEDMCLGNTVKLPPSFSLCAWDAKYNDIHSFIYKNKSHLILDARPLIHNSKLKSLMWTYSHEDQSV